MFFSYLFERGHPISKLKGEATNARPPPPPNKHQGRKTSAKLGLTHPSFTLEPLDPNLIGKQGTLVARPPGEVPEGLALPSARQASGDWGGWVNSWQE